MGAGTVALSGENLLLLKPKFMPIYGLLSYTDDFSHSYVLLSIDEKNLHYQLANKDYSCLASFSNFV